MKRQSIPVPSWRFVVVCCIALVVVLAVIGIGNIGGNERRATGHKEFLQKMAKGVKRDLVYFEDERTGLCYAYIWGGDSHGGPALTLVPREKVEHLLIK